MRLNISTLKNKEIFFLEGIWNSIEVTRCCQEKSTELVKQLLRLLWLFTVTEICKKRYVKADESYNISRLCSYPLSYGVALNYQLDSDSGELFANCQCQFYDRPYPMQLELLRLQYDLLLHSLNQSEIMIFWYSDHIYLLFHIYPGKDNLSKYVPQKQQPRNSFTAFQLSKCFLSERLNILLRVFFGTAL